MELDLKRDVEPQLLAELMNLRAGTDDHTVRRPETLRGTEDDAAIPLGELEDLGADDPVAESPGKPINSRAHVDRTADLIEKRLVLGRREDGQRSDLPGSINGPRSYARRLKRSRPPRNVRTANQHALTAEQPNSELLLEPLPLAPRAHSEPDEPLIVMTMPKHPRPPSRLP